MSTETSIDWIAALGRLGPGDLKRISHLVDLLVVATPARADAARRMLGAAPEPWTYEEARARCEAITRFLERCSADAGEALDTDFDSHTATDNGGPHGYC